MTFTVSDFWLKYIIFTCCLLLLTLVCCCINKLVDALFQYNRNHDIDAAAQDGERAVRPFRPSSRPNIIPPPQPGEARNRDREFYMLPRNIQEAIIDAECDMLESERERERQRERDQLKLEHELAGQQEDRMEINEDEDGVMDREFSMLPEFVREAVLGVECAQRERERARQQEDRMEIDEDEDGVMSTDTVFAKMSGTLIPVVTAPGMRMPIIGLGTWQSPEDEVQTVLDAALAVGYRHIDTAFLYNNEAAIGRTLKKWFDSGKLKREDLFIVTKLPHQAMQASLVEEFLCKSLAALQLSYVDLYLIHHPVGLAPNEGPWAKDEQGNIKVDMKTDHVAIWKAMEAQVDAGRAKAIGVSNFNTRQVDRLLKIARIPPANLQVEIHVYFQQKDLQSWSKKTGVTLCAYGPLGSPAMKNYVASRGLNADGVRDLNPLTDPVVQRIATTHNKTEAQVLLRHLIQLGIAVIPKSTNPQRINSNFQVFDFKLSDQEMAELNALDKGEEGRRFVGDLFKGFELHPEKPF